VSLSNNIKSESLKRSLSQIFRFGLIKVAPGVFNIALIPYLLVALGPESYGQYSTWLGYSMLVANTIAAIVSQPMYRYLSSRPEEGEKFAGLSVLAAVLAGLISFGVAVLVGSPSFLALGFSTLSVGIVLSTAASIGYIVANDIFRLAAYEFLRILAISLVLIGPVLFGKVLTINHVVLSMALSNILPLLLLTRRQRITLPRGAWLSRYVPYGFKSAAWLMLAGLPIVSAKSILMEVMPDQAFGTYAAVADLTYRGFAIANAALMMWAFPRLSRQYDAGNIAMVRQTLRLSLLAYCTSGFAMIGGLGVASAWHLVDLTALTHGLFTALIITLGSFSWHAMSIAHKPFELTLRTAQMASLMAVGVVAFYALSFGLIQFDGLNPLYVVTLSMVVVAIAYSSFALMQRLGN